jgi:1-acyl-sn-glycerol-3-phosphate acyltransferase
MQRAFRLLNLAGLLLSGTLTLLLLFPFLDRDERDRRIVRWAGKLLRIVGGRLRVVGRPPRVRGEGALIVANHVSWLDIHALHSVLPARFISKADVRNWPLIGWMAESTGTLFLERSRKSDAARMNREMADHLRSGECLSLFPEGTTTDGTDVLPFFPSLLQPAIDAEAKIWPLVIRYLDEQGGYNPAPAYFGGTTLLESLLRVVREPFFYVELTFLPPVAACGRHRRELARELETTIRAVLAGDGRDRAPETAAHPQADRQ